MSGLDPEFKEKYGPWVLICGASDGIGEAFAKQVAEAGLNIVLMARREPMLKELAARLEAEHGIATRVLAADLTSPSLMKTVAAKTSDLEIGLLLYVSGSATEHVDFIDGDLDFWIQQLRLNCDGPVLLGHHFGSKMRERRRGGMMFLTSLACQSGASRMSLYTGTKAFDQMFAESLWHELSPYDVDVLCLMVGATHTPTANETLGLDFSALFPDMSMVATAEQVARDGLENIANGPVYVASKLLRGALAHLSPEARAAVVEGGSLSTAKLDGFDAYLPVWDLTKNAKVER
jgi:short-subunit dehydrogenase